MARAWAEFGAETAADGDAWALAAGAVPELADCAQAAGPLKTKERIAAATAARIAGPNCDVFRVMLHPDVCM